MKSIIAGAAALLIFATAAPAFAQDHRDQRDQRDHRDNRNHGYVVVRHAPPPRAHARWREGQMWHGHRVTDRGGHWGYYQPRNGANIFINIPL